MLVVAGFFLIASGLFLLPIPLLQKYRLKRVDDSQNDEKNVNFLDDKRTKKIDDDDNLRNNDNDKKNNNVNNKIKQ